VPASLDGIEYQLWRQTLADGEATTLYAVRHPSRSTRVRVVHFPRPQRLDVWCVSKRTPEAIVGGFFLRDPYRPLGELWRGGRAADHEPVQAPYGARRACVAVDGNGVRLNGRDGEPAGPEGDLLQAGPLLVRDGAPVFRREDDREGFSAGMAQFDSDITDGRYPRAALGLADGRLFAVACDGRGRFDAGLTLEELAALMAALGCSTALNLDGGGSTSLVSGGRLRNRPRGGWERPEVGGRPVSTALLFLPRSA
jgi:Phosphodiester glycosidase